MVEDRYYADDALTDIIGQYHTNVKTLSIASGAVENACGNLLQTTSESDIFIIATANAHLDDRQEDIVRYLLSSGRRIIVIAVRNPYDLQAFPQLRTYLVTSEYTQPALVPPVPVLFSHSQSPPHFPVHIP